MPSDGAPAAALALVGGGLRDRLDRQPLHLQPRAVAADARGPGIDDVADPGHRQRRLRDVRGEHDAAVARGRWKTRCCSAADSRAYSGRISTSLAEPPAQRLGRVADLALAGEEDEHVAGALAQQLLDRIADRLEPGRAPRPHRPVAASTGYVRPDTSTTGASPKCSPNRSGSIVARRDDQLQLRPPRQDPLEVAEQEVDVEARSCASSTASAAPVLSGGPSDALVMRVHYAHGRLHEVSRMPASRWAAAVSAPWRIGRCARVPGRLGELRLYQAADAGIGPPRGWTASSAW